MSQELFKEGYRNFDPKSLAEEERFIKKLVDTPKSIVAGREFLDNREGSFSFMETKGRES